MDLENIIICKPFSECSHRRQTRVNNLIIQQRLQNVSRNNQSDLEDEDEDEEVEDEEEEDASSQASNSSDESNSTVNNNDDQMMDVDNNEPDDNIHDVGEELSEQESNNSGFESSSEEENEDFEACLGDVFRNSSINLNQVQCKAILNVLPTHPCFSTLPKDPRTILKTLSMKAPVIPLAGGEYIHLGFEKKINSILKSTPANKIPQLLKIDYHTDGASPDESRKTCMWPIQVRITNIPNSKPKMVGIYKGKK